MALTEINSLGIKDGEVKTADIAADAVTGAKIADDAVGAEHIEDLDANVKFLDNVNAIFGTGNDLYIYHDGTSSYVSDLGSGDFNLTTNGAKISLKKGTSETLADFTPDGSVDLYHDNSKKVETTASGITVTGGVTTTTASTFVGDVTFDNGTNANKDLRWDESVDSLEFDDSVKATFGADGDLQIYHDGTNSSIKNTTGDLYIDDAGGNIYIQAKAGEQSIVAFADGAVDLYHNNVKKLETTANGITVTGTVTATGGGLGGLFSSYALVWDEKSATTDGGTFDSGDWRTRDLNQEEDPDSIVSISSNEFTLGAGTYLIKWRCPAYDVQTHESRLVDVTNSNAYPGTTELAWSSETHQTWSSGMKRRTISGNTAFRIEHRCETSSSNNGFGIQGPDWSMANIFTQVEIYKES